MQFVQHFKLLALAVATSFSTQADEFQLTPYTSFTAHGNHVTEVSLPDEGFSAEKVLLEVELGCAQIGCSDWDYTVRYEWQVGDEKFELGRLITPYAGYMQRGMHGFDRNWRRKYVFDVTHLTPVLKQKGQLVAHYGGWGAKKSAFGFAAKLITQGSEPVREAKRVVNLYRSGSEGWPYKTAQSFGEYLKPQAVEFAPDETYAEVKVTVSAHGHALSFDNPKNQPELCGEWCERYFDLLQGGETVVRQPLWRDNCDQTATFPQGGTYIFSRANWCPGEIVEPFSYPVDPNSGEFDIDWQAYSWQPSQWGNTAPRYIVSAQLVTYGPKQQTTDLAVETILSPNRDLDVRNSQSCGLVEVLVKNNGETPIYDIAFDYGIDSGNRHQFAWQGELAANQQVTVNLPGFNWGMFDTDTAQFSVVAKTAGDTQPDNNQAFSHIEAPLMVTSDTVLSLLTGKLPEQTRVEIVDRNGEVVSRWDDFAASTNHDLPLDLSKGCYSLNVYDSGHDGLDNPFTRGRQGKGALKLVSNNGEQQLQADFGRMLQLPFTLDYPLGQCLESTWQSGQPYAEPGEMVSYKGIVYKARHWSYDFEPDKSGPWDAWAPVSYCDGTAL